MTASLESFVNTIKDRNHEELLTIILELKAASLQDAAIIAEFRRSSTEMSKEYCRMKTELEAIRTEQKELQKKYNHVCEENASLTRLRFGRQSEKLSSLINISPAENTDPLAESSVPDRADTLDSQESAGMKAVLSRPKQHYNKTVGKRVRDLSGLPCVNVFDLDVEKLDAEYGRRMADLQLAYTYDCGANPCGVIPESFPHPRPFGWTGAPARQHSGGKRTSQIQLGFLFAGSFHHLL